MTANGTDPYIAVLVADPPLLTPVQVQQLRQLLTPTRAETGTSSRTRTPASPHVRAAA